MDVQPSPSSDPSRPSNAHPIFWFEDGRLVIQVDDTLYKVHQSLLSREYVLFEACLGIPSKTEGDGTLAVPLKLFLVEAEGFELFLEMIYPPVPRTDEGGDLVMVDPPTPIALELRAHRLLAASDHLDAARGKALAVSALRALNLPAIRRLSYGKMFTLETQEWIIMPAKELWSRPIRSLTFEEHGDLSYQMLKFLASRHEEYREYVELIAIRVPVRDIHDEESCFNHQGCAAAWSEFWMNTVVKFLFHPNPSLRLQLDDKLQEKLMLLTTPTGMVNDCKIFKIIRMQVDGIFAKEEVYKQAFASDIATLFKQMF
ncbi:hypothetical protein C8J56DRAFT_1037420 [Mycena floridula]|nr:hypothetical protein C8J56DRAFT_1037420 [Mycena floridula]